MVVEITNPRNQHMHNGDKPVAGVIAASDSLPNRILYTNTYANRVYNDMQYDIYKSAKKTKSPKEKGFTNVFIVLSALIALGTAIKFRKNIYDFAKNLYAKIKSVFKKKPVSPITP